MIAAASALALRLKVAESMSAKTGRAPNRAIDPAVATKVKGVVTTSSPGPMPRAIRASRRASDPEAHAIAKRQPTNSAISSSRDSTSGPRMKCCDSITRRIAASTSSRIPRNCARRSRNVKGEASSIGLAALNPISKSLVRFTILLVL